ncbi:putative nucleic acid-binding protein, contains PIN domain (plasmid) [Synechococcus sp. PCC 7502]|uniref:putative toxin-antitoxin system toxin component, PIN family n=1 Tax=Synechococcus sp. PCC 7502 TaxID=1173263 RepID=UPI00029FC780|nr:putative toxin-antitoxin system toxin component, PIN family [Synechococcus sp. PCC 7502]AFY75452.1 putative nucleic acid-binding protein, contains PIN domain [Synechococcus sp. PCC 7502]
MKPNVVFDTNILISAVLSPSGKPFQCTALAKRAIITSTTCDEILQEFEEKLIKKLRFEPQRAKSLIDEILDYSTLVKLTEIPRVVIDDPDDDCIVQCALTGKANYIISGDKHLLNLIQYKDIVIVKAASFISLILE